MIALALTLAACGGAPTDPMVVRAPSAFSMPTIDGKAVHKGARDRGLITVTSKPVTQDLFWEPVSRPLGDAARHEIGLIARAADAPEGSADDTALVDAVVAGRPGLSWELRVERTTFVGTVFDCPDVRVILVTMGPKAAHVREVHARSLGGAGCG